MQVRWMLAFAFALAFSAVAAAQDSGIASKLETIRSVGVDGAPLQERKAAAEGLGETSGADLPALWTTLETLQIFRHNRDIEAKRLEKQIGTLRRLGDGPRDEQGRAKKKLEEKREALAKVRAEIDGEDALIAQLYGAAEGAFTRTPEKGRDDAVAPLLARYKDAEDLFRRERLAALFGRFPTRSIERELVGALGDDHLPVRVEAAQSLAMHAAKAGTTPDATWTKLYAKIPRELASLERERRKVHKEYERQGKKFVKTTTGKAVALPKAARLPDEKRLLAERRLASLDAVVVAYRELLAAVHMVLPEAVRTEELAPLLAKLERARKPEDATFLVETLSYVDDPAARAALEQQLAHEAPEVRIAVCDALARQADAKAAIALTSAVEDPFWQVRVAAIDALRQLGGRDAVDGLIIGMAKAEGRVIHDLAEALQALTGQNFHDNKVLWKKWWKENRTAYAGPPAKAPAPDAPAAPDAGGGAAPPGGAAQPGDRVSFYGIETRSKRIVYILDVSGSMQWRLAAYSSGGGRPPEKAPTGERKFDHAVKELKRSITSLPKDATFNIVCYSDVVRVWQKTLVDASPDQKAKAFDWVDSALVDGATNIFDAVERAFGLAGRGTRDKRYGLAADTFYLLTDGRPNRGRVIEPDAMITEIGRLNKFKRVVIHTIGLGRDADWEFLEKLAEQSGGQCKLITGKKG